MIRTLLVVAVVLASARWTMAQNAEVPALIKLVENQPADMDRSVWKEKRRDAARKLAQSKDKRAVPTLIKLAESETFDIIGEIAIEGLGNLRDPSAVSVLQKIANDLSREKPQRDLAKKALAKLNAPATPPPDKGTPDKGTPDKGTPDKGTPDKGTPDKGTPDKGTPDKGTPDKGTGNLGTGTGDTGVLGTGKLGGDKPRGGGLIGKPAEGLPVPPDFPDDTIAAWDRLTFALGGANLNYDTVRRRSSFDIDVNSAWARRVERERVAFGWDAGAHLITGYINPTGGAAGRAQSRGTQFNLSGGGEARFYTGKIYGVGRAAVGSQIFNIAVKDANDPANDISDTRTTADLQIALGGGYGRLLDVGGAIRVRRLQRMLDAAKALGKPIDPAVAKKLQLAWWALRSERSSYRALLATVAILREAGVLLVEPDAGLTFEILNVLRDSQLFMRPSGIDIQVAFGEGYLRRPDDNMGAFPFSGEQGRVEQLLASAGYGIQLADDTVEVSGTAYARYRLFAPTGNNLDQPSPYAFGATARFRRFTYGDHGDPFGALDVSATLQVSDDKPIMQVNGGESDLGVRLSGQIGFTYWLNQASGVRLAATGAVDGGEFFIGAQLSMTYGFLDATFSQ